MRGGTLITALVRLDHARRLAVVALCATLVVTPLPAHDGRTDTTTAVEALAGAAGAIGQVVGTVGGGVTDAVVSAGRATGDALGQLGALLASAPDAIGDTVERAERLPETRDRHDDGRDELVDSLGYAP